LNCDYEVIVIGAGAAGLVAAAEAASRGRRTLLVEKNRRPGVKILMSGGTRCNLTHATDKWGIIRAYGEQGNFLHSALAALSPTDLVALIEQEGVPTKVEETGKIFPISNRATDVLDALLRRLERSGAELALAEAVSSIERHEGKFLVITPSRLISAEKVVITVGGQSYPGSGTTGDGYAWAAAFGHKVVRPRPALVPLTTGEGWVHALSGVTVPDASLSLFILGDGPPRTRGSLLFTHFGLSGPVALDISRHVTDITPYLTALPGPPTLTLLVDFLPDQRSDALAEELRKTTAADGKRQLAGLLSDRLPRRLVEALLTRAGLSPETRGAEFSKAARSGLVRALKQTEIPISGTRGFAKAEVTAGGVCLDEIDSRTMESKLVAGLYFAGEILDLDGPIGGYNFQAAFSTGVLAGRSV
jgi:predicted Rossmann fold flavoprotein